jgi:hypothetical protein
MYSRTLYRVAPFIADVSENISPPSSGVVMFMGFHSRITVFTLVLSLSIEGHHKMLKNSVFWDVFTEVSIKDVFWDFVPCSTN